MSASGYPKFKNDNATPEIRISAKEFKCIGVSPPQDHPHVYLEMGESDSILCPYCATRFSFDDTLNSNEADPPECLFIDEYNEQ